MWCVHREPDVVELILDAFNDHRINAHACMLMDRNCDNRLGLSGGGRLALACVAIKPLKGADTLGMCYQ